VLVGLTVELQLTPDRVADPSFQTAERFSAALSLSEFASEIGTAGVVVSDLGDSSDVDGVVQPPVPGSVESVPVLITRRPQPEVQAASHSRATIPAKGSGSRFTSEPSRTQPEDSYSLQVTSTSNKRPDSSRASCPTDKRLGMSLWAVEKTPDGPARSYDRAERGFVLLGYALLNRTQLVKP